jgi:hypothetical protein
MWLWIAIDIGLKACGKPLPNRTGTASDGARDSHGRRIRCRIALDDSEVTET